MTPPLRRYKLEHFLRLTARDVHRGPLSWTYSNGTRLATIPTEAGVVVAAGHLPDGGEAWHAVGYPLQLAARPTNRGGPNARQWFLKCPRCTAHRRALYAAPHALGSWRCRVCWGATYPATRENVEWRAFRRVQRVAARLGVVDLVPADSFELAHYGALEKPHRMRWTTFQRLNAALRTRAAVHAGHSWGALQRLARSIAPTLLQSPDDGQVMTR
jgi:hypothetical protein